MTNRADDDHKPGSNGIKEKVSTLQRDIERMRANIGEIFARLSELAKTNWQNIYAAAGVAILIISGFWFLSAAPIKDELRRIDAGLAWTQKELTDKYVRQDVLTAQLKNMDQQLSYLTRQVEDIRRDFREIAPPSKLLDQLIRRIEQLESGRLSDTRRNESRELNK